MFGTADPGPQIAFLGSFGSLRPFGAELAITAFGLACQQMKQAGTLTNEQSSESAHGARDSTYQQNTTNIGRKPVEITARRSAGSPEQPAAATENALRIQIWTALIAILLLNGYTICRRPNGPCPIWPQCCGSTCSLIVTCGSGWTTRSRHRP